MKKETPTQVLTCEFYDIFKTTFFTESNSGRLLRKPYNHRYSTEKLLSNCVIFSGERMGQCEV